MKINPRILVGVAITLLFSYAGCARTTTVIRWQKVGGTQEEFMRDRYTCIQDARRRVSGAYVQGGSGSASSGEVISRDIFVSCMGARGYVQDANGPFTAPPGGVVILH